MKQFESARGFVGAKGLDAMQSNPYCGMTQPGSPDVKLALAADMIGQRSQSVTRELVAPALLGACRGTERRGDLP